METAAKPSAVHPAVVAGEGTATVAQQSDKKTQPGADPKAERKPVRARQDDKWKIFSGTANDALAKDICDFLGLPLGQTHISKFSDGETYVQIDGERARRRCFHGAADVRSGGPAPDAVAAAD